MLTTNTNCPNCGAPIDIHAEKCAYCDTPYVYISRDDLVMAPQLIDTIEEVERETKYLRNVTWQMDKMAAIIRGFSISTDEAVEAINKFSAISRRKRYLNTVKNVKYGIK